MKPILKLILRLVKIAAIIVVGFVVLVIAGVWLINMPSVQNKILAHATQLLQEKLETKVEIDSIHIGFFSDDVRLYNLRVEDRQHRPMLRLEYLGAEIDSWALLKDEVQMEEIVIKGLHAKLYKGKTDSVANYQFVIDAFKSKKKPEEQKKKKPGKHLTVDLQKLHIEDIDFVYNDSHFALGSLHLKQSWGDRLTGELKKVEGSWVRIKKRDSVHVDNHILVDRIIYEGQEKHGSVVIDSVHWTTDNHLPHKRVLKPKRGWFDDGHLNVVGYLRVDVKHADKDSICGTLTKCDVNDKASGFHLTDVNMKFRKIAEQLEVSDAVICMANTKLQFDKGEVQLPSKKKGIPFRFSTSPISGTTLLKDIAHPFAPVLKNFELPLWLTTKFYGNDSTLFFKDILVKTTDNKFNAKAVGHVAGIKDKYKLDVHFDILQCVVQGNSKERIIKQFPVKRFMMKQLHALGTLHYKGSFDVKYKRVEFRGNIGTACGAMNFALKLDGLNKYVTGNVLSNAFELGKAMDYPDVGRIGARAGFKIDISKERTGAMRRKVGGKLPMCQVDAIVYEAKYKGIKVTDVYANIVSNGAVAEGKLKMKGALADVMCSFSFTDTDQMQKTKIKPGIRFHLFNNDYKNDKELADHEKRKAERKAAKEKEKAAKEKEKEAKKQQKAAEKEKRAAEKAAEKEKRAAEKAARKAAKKAAKEAAKNQN